MCNYNKFFKYVFKNWKYQDKIEKFNLKHQMGENKNSPRMTPCVLGWGQENGLVNKDPNNVVLIPSPNGGYQGYVINVDPFTLKCYESFTPWYIKLWKLAVDSCGKYWIPIMLFSFVQFILTSILPLVWSWLI
jgi:hypothetical protein